MKELGNENVHLKHVCHILTFYISQDIDKPLKVPVGGTYPNKVDFLIADTGVTICRCAKDEIIQNGCVRCDSDTTADHHCHFILVPILVSASKWTLDADPGRNGCVEQFVVL